MFTNADFVVAGSCRKPHGIKGLIRAELADFDAEALMERDAFVFFEIDGTYIPFALESVEWLNDYEALLKLEDIDDNNAAEPLVGKNILLLAADAKRAGLQVQASGLTGYELMDAKAGSLGVIKEIDTSTANMFLTTAKGFTLPLHEDFVVSVNTEDRVVHTCYTPEILEFLEL